MLITPDEPPEARRGCPSETSKINKLLKIITTNLKIIQKDCRMTLFNSIYFDWKKTIDYCFPGREVEHILTLIEYNS